MRKLGGGGGGMEGVSVLHEEPFNEFGGEVLV